MFLLPNVTHTLKKISCKQNNSDPDKKHLITIPVNNDSSGKKRFNIKTENNIKQSINITVTISGVLSDLTSLLRV